MNFSKTYDSSGPKGIPALDLVDIEAGYGRTTVLRGLHLSVVQGSVVALLGANGAGKTTLLRVAAGLVRPSRGTVLVNGEEATKWPPSRRARGGVCLIPEGRGVFRSLTVRDNLELAIPPWRRHLRDIGPAVSAFPALARRLRQVAGSMSGGEQQMLALARAYLASPKILLVDELSIGLAPVVVDSLLESVRLLTATGMTLVVVEQYVDRVLDFAQTVHLMSRGELRWSGPPSALSGSGMLETYLGRVSPPS